MWLWNLFFRNLWLAWHWQAPASEVFIAFALFESPDLQKASHMQENNLMPDRLNVLQRILYSIFPGTLDRPKYRERYRSFFNSLILHFRPRSVQDRTLRFTLTWGLGGMAVVLVCTLFATGLMLKFVYQPVPDRAKGRPVHYAWRRTLYYPL